MRRRSEMDDSSGALELFLDTLCNAFGGIIFISLLVCIMLQLAGEKLAPPPPQDKAKLERRLAKLTGEIEALAGDYKSLQGQLGDIIPDTDPKLIREYERLQQEQADQEKIKQDLADALGRLTIEIKTKGPFLAQLEKKRDDLTAEQLALKKALDEKRVPVNIRFPRARDTKKNPVSIVLEGGRFALLYKFDEQGAVLRNGQGGPVRNDADVEIKDIMDNEVKRLLVRLKPGRGTVVTDDQQFADRFVALTSRFVAKPTPENGIPEEKCHYFPVAVWPDSYTQFEILRDLLLKRGFDYGLALVEEGKRAKTGKGGTQ